jgi:hypothetical protein
VGSPTRRNCAASLRLRSRKKGPRQSYVTIGLRILCLEHEPVRLTAQAIVDAHARSWDDRQTVGEFSDDRSAQIKCLTRSCQRLAGESKCTSATSAFTPCYIASCLDVCSGDLPEGGEPGPDAGPTANCQKLAMCCTTIADSSFSASQAACEQIVAANQDQACVDALSSYAADGGPCGL